MTNKGFRFILLDRWKHGSSDDPTATALPTANARIANLAQQHEWKDVLRRSSSYKIERLFLNTKCLQDG